MKIGDRVVLIKRPIDSLPESGTGGTISDISFINDTIRSELLVEFDDHLGVTLVLSAWLRVLTAVDRLAQLGDAP